jgi:hypothetical protein
MTGSSGRFRGTTVPQSRHDLGAGVTPGQLRGPGWRRVHRDRYLPAGVSPVATGQRIVEAASRAPQSGAVGGWAAAWALGVDLCDGLGRDGRTLLDVPLVVGPLRQIRRVPGIDLWYDRLRSEEVVVVDGVPVTVAPRTCFDGMRRAENLVEAVVFADLLLHAELVGLSEMVAFYPDLLEPGAGTVGEYDGKGHRETERHHDDNVREELFEDHGLVVTRATKVDFRHRLGLAARMGRARARGLARDRRRDRWTLEPPPDWGAMCPESDLHELFDELDATWVPPW